MTDVTFPELSRAEPDAVGLVATWFVADGETVVTGQLLAEVQLEKVSAEVYAPVGGAVHLAVGEQVPVQQREVIATVG